MKQLQRVLIRFLALFRSVNAATRRSNTLNHSHAADLVSNMGPLACPTCGHVKEPLKDPHLEFIHRLSIEPANFPVIGAMSMAKMYGWESMWMFQMFGANDARKWINEQ